MHLEGNFNASAQSVQLKRLVSSLEFKDASSVMLVHLCNQPVALGLG